MQKNPYHPERTIETLGPDFYDPVSAANFPKHLVRYRNQSAASTVGLDDLEDTAWLNHFGRFHPLPGSLPKPLALRYHGHQFRHYNPDIGDGRGFLFAQLRDGRGRLLDLGTKGSGQTPFSRFGDGRLTLKGGVREVLATEMLEALGVETSKTFSLIETGEALERGDEPSPTRSAVMVRLSHGHIRYGTFQRLATLNDAPALERLVDYVLEHFIRQPQHANINDKVAVLMDYAVRNAAQQAAAFMAAGFVHGVLNTDNINITGESFDYGPFRFAPTADPAFTAAYFDHGGLYAYGRQAEALHWNVYQLAKSLLTLVPQEALVPALEAYPKYFHLAYTAAMHTRLGIKPDDDDTKTPSRLTMIETALQASKCPLDQFYFDVYGGPLSAHRRTPTHYDPDIFKPIFKMLDTATPADDAAYCLKAPYFSAANPCSLLIDEIESIWAAINECDDWSLFEAKIQQIRSMKTAYGREPAVS